MNDIYSATLLSFSSFSLEEHLVRDGDVGDDERLSDGDSERLLEDNVDDISVGGVELVTLPAAMDKLIGEVVSLTGGVMSSVELDLTLEARWAR